MADSGANLNFDFNNNQISGELNDNGEITYFEAQGNAINARFKKKNSQKEKDKLKFDTTGIPQLATVAPNPLDREDLIDKKYSAKPISQQSWVCFVVTVAAIFFDLLCYSMMFEGMGNSRDDVDAAFYFAAIAAAFAIDIIPAFFARILYIITKNQKVVLTIFFIVSFLFIGVFLLVIFGVRCNYFEMNYSHLNITNESVVQCLIPIATTLVCFIVNYLAYDPYEKKLKNLHKIKLFREENINELEALIVEIDNEPNFFERLVEQDEQLYEGAENLIDAVSDHERAYIRSVLMLNQQSPADTSDLAVNIF